MKSCKPYLMHIIQECEFLEKATRQVVYEDFVKDPVLTRAVVRSLEVIGEAVKNLPQDFRVQHPQVPWKEIAGMRDKLIHHYFGINYKVVWATVQYDIPKLHKQIQSILATIP
ncbi:conserved hypothetical protein [Thermosulfidibacter takaii ABI70S6]|uniref:DUF86 domain-containing protein n=1 Tax=Thermosulfidibacter takaii (strain DSM 17441 / JCM 13301 / NBRC 103674 / ABI70S6) TaxID=1298851 RepID=A0A0S3QUG3_THET7|nr:DUF86 domain-containing protein [Thermosulfidibacter takaii]BAT71956.1 conserved hypothetical protein [Thermosulfidibacter takaii ABI70S6]